MNKLKILDSGRMDSFVTELLAAASFSDSSSEISFEVYCEEFNLDQKLFIGLLEEGDYDGTVRRAGIGVSICPRTGEIADMINGQSIIGYLVEAPLETWKSMRIALNVEKIGPVYIPKVIVGDEAILTWRPRDGLRDCNCLATYFAFTHTLEERRTHYEDSYGCFPEFKAGVNIGPVTVAEVGVLRREIAYLSDVLNTAARIQGECNKLKCPGLIIADLRNRLPEDQPYSLESKGELPLRGKETNLEIFGVSE